MTAADRPRSAGAGRAPSKLLVLAAFGVAVGMTMTRHEMWRDELQAWMLARDAPTLSALADHLRYEGHPFLWYLALWWPARHVGAPWPMQALQWSVAMATLALVLARAPFTRSQKALFALGYFVLFEYGVISRSYSLGFLYLVATCALFGTRHRWPWSGPLLGLLAFTSAFGAILAGATLAALVTDEAVRYRQRESRPLVRTAIGVAVALGAFVAAYRQGAHPGDRGVFRSWKTDFDLDLANTAAAAVWRALVPLPRPTRTFWNSNLLDGATFAGTLVGLAAALGILWLLRHRPAAAVMWSVGTAATVAFLYAKIRYAGAARHYGHIFLALVAALWLATGAAARGDEDAGQRSAHVRSRWWTALLAVHAVAGLFAVGMDLALPFSNGRQVAGYLRDQELDREFIIGVPDTSASVIAAYLDRGIYYPAGDRVGTYVLWDEERGDPTEPLAEGLRRLAVGDRPVLLVSNRPEAPETGLDLELVAVFDDGIVADERYWLFRVVTGS